MLKLINSVISVAPTSCVDAGKLDVTGVTKIVPYAWYDALHLFTGNGSEAYVQRDFDFAQPHPHANKEIVIAPFKASIFAFLSNFKTSNLYSVEKWFG